MLRSFFNSRSGLFMCITGRGDDDDDDGDGDDDVHVCMYFTCGLPSCLEVSEKHVIRTRWSLIETIPH